MNRSYSCGVTTMEEEIISTRDGHNHFNTAFKAEG